jgi:hypothetical protein
VRPIPSILGNFFYLCLALGSCKHLFQTMWVQQKHINWEIRVLVHLKSESLPLLHHLYMSAYEHYQTSKRNMENYSDDSEGWKKNGITVLKCITVNCGNQKAERKLYVIYGGADLNSHYWNESCHYILQIRHIMPTQDYCAKHHLLPSEECTCRGSVLQHKPDPAASPYLGFEAGSWAALLQECGNLYKWNGVEIYCEYLFKICERL